MNFRSGYLILLILLTASLVSPLVNRDNSKLETMKNEFPTVTGNNLNKEKITKD